MPEEQLSSLQQPTHVQAQQPADTAPSAQPGTMSSGQSVSKSKSFGAMLTTMAQRIGRGAKALTTFPERLKHHFEQGHVKALHPQKIVPQTPPPPTVKAEASTTIAPQEHDEIGIMEETKHEAGIKLVAAEKELNQAKAHRFSAWQALLFLHTSPEPPTEQERQAARQKLKDADRDLAQAKQKALLARADVNDAIAAIEEHQEIPPHSAA